MPRGERPAPSAARLNRVLFALLLLCAVALAFVLQHAILSDSAAQQAEEAYQQAMAELEEARKPIEVSEFVSVEVGTLREIIQPASELVTYKYYYTDAGVYEKSRKLFNTGIVLPFTTDRTVYTYSGVIGAGVDLMRTDFAIDNQKRTIVVYLQEPAIIYHELDENSFESYDVRTSAFTRSNLADFSDFRAALKSTQEEKLLANETFWSEAKSNAKNVISNLVTLSGAVEDYTVSYEWLAD